MDYRPVFVFRRSVYRRKYRKNRVVLTLTFELVVPHRIDPPLLHPLRRLALSPHRLDGVRVKVRAQPSQIAIADERIPCQMSARNRGMSLSSRCTRGSAVCDNLLSVVYGDSFVEPFHSLKRGVIGGHTLGKHLRALSLRCRKIKYGGRLNNFKGGHQPDGPENRISFSYFISSSKRVGRYVKRIFRNEKHRTKLQR